MERTTERVPEVLGYLEPLGFFHMPPLSAKPQALSYGLLHRAGQVAQSFIALGSKSVNPDLRWGGGALSGGFFYRSGAKALRSGHPCLFLYKQLPTKTRALFIPMAASHVQGRCR